MIISVKAFRISDKWILEKEKLYSSFQMFVLKWRIETSWLMSSEASE